MKNFTLKTPDEAEREITKVIKHGLSSQDDFLLISCRDEGAFTDDARLSLGKIRLAPISQHSLDKVADHDLAITKQLRLGAYEWYPPKFDDAKKQLATALGFNEEDKSKFPLDALLADIASVVVRLGLSNPTFDPAALEDMPYKHPTTIVVDTSGVLQGGLDFVANFLHPAGRVKIPAIVNMEIINTADSFLSLRRSKSKASASKRKRQLEDHLISQGGQRALLRIELQADTEIERTFLLGDPLRDAFAKDNDGDVSQLNISRPIRTYVDRLILEAARHHQAQTGPTHEVRLLTGDQGLARMALAEGIVPLYFNATKADKFFGTRLSGRTLHPFSGIIQSISLSKLLWEFATAIGEVKIQNEAGNCSYTVCAIGKNFSWSPYHSIDDLLWCSMELPSGKQTPPQENRKKDRSKKTRLEIPHNDVEKADTSNQDSIEPDKTPFSKVRNKILRKKVTEKRVAFPRFDVNKMLRLVCFLDDTQRPSIDDVVDELGVKDRKGVDEYKRFLTSAGLIQIENDHWNVGSGISTLSGALRNERSDEVHQCFLAAPSYNEFVNRLGQLEIGEILEKSYFGRGINAYRILGEIGQICAEVRGEGIYSTVNDPETAQFASLARLRFTDLESGSGLVSAGAWLEELIRKDGIHPVIARRRLNQASENGFIRRSTEGSTIQIRNDDHVLHVLKANSGIPRVEKIHLYRGDFLIPGKASVSLRILDSKP